MREFLDEFFYLKLGLVRRQLRLSLVTNLLFFSAFVFLLWQWPEDRLLFDKEKSTEYNRSVLILSNFKTEQFFDADIQYRIGWRYAYGPKDDRSHEEANVWFQKAAEQGHSKAQYALGQAYLNGRAVVRDYGKAISWYRKSANQGYPPAHYAIAHLHRNGLGVPKDYQQAFTGYKRAADLGMAMAQVVVGNAYRWGVGTELSYKDAIIYYEKAVAQDNAAAHYRLGQMHEDGLGVPVSFPKALEHYQAARKLKYPKARSAIKSLLKKAKRNNHRLDSTT